jgi:hypothetical protein
MPNPKKTSPAEETESSEHQEIHSEDFQFVLKHLLAAYQPVLEEDLKRAKSPEELKKEAESKPASCEDEVTLANRIFEKFVTEEVAVRLLPEEGRKQLGAIENWRWCFLHIRCCIIFGWLLCRRQRTFRAFAYYLYRYWLCVRQVLGTPVSHPPTAEEREDFQVLVNALASSYKPYLTDQLASVEFPTGIPDEVFEGKIDCLEGEEQAASIFERMLTVETAPALLGRKAFEVHSKDPNFWFCRCWCLCAIRFGCCLAHARNFIDVLRCLRFYRRCLRDCFKPLTCDITSPAPGACAAEQFYPVPGVWGIEIVGTATGAFCDHYILEWKDQGAPAADYTQNFIVYTSPAPPGGPGACGKVGAPLGYLETYGNPIPNDVDVRLRVFSSQSGQQPCVWEVAFQIFETRVSIENVAGINVPDWSDPNSQLVGVPPSPTPSGPSRVLSFGDALEIWGHAWVGGCSNLQIQRYTLSYQAGFVTDPKAGTWTQFWEVDYNSARQQAAINNNYMDLTSFWEFVQICLPPFPPCPRPFPPFLQPYPIEYDRLDPTSWYSGVGSPCTAGPGIPPGQVFRIDPEAPPVWASQALPPSNCYSGQYTLLLTVEDTSKNLYYDTQQVWFDNKAVYGEITGILGVPPCSVINLSQIPNAGNCNVAWPLAIEGIAYDEYIIEGNTAPPSDNLGGYCLTVTRQGGSESSPCNPVSLSVALPIPNPTSPTTIGTNRVGDPGVRCATASPPPLVPPVKMTNILTTMDARMFDVTCACKATPAPMAGFALKRADPTSIPPLPGECCSFWFALDVWDNTVCEFLSGGRHYAAAPCVLFWPVYICNDLPPLPPGTPPPCP